MERYYFFIYLLYGLVFITMGIYTSSKKEKEIIHIPLVKSLKYLGAFGILHGFSEWVSMVMVTDLYANEYLYLFYIKQFLKAVSFTYLLLFALKLLNIRIEKWKYVRYLPISIFILGGIGMALLMIKYGSHYHLSNPEYNSILLRYFMGLPGGVIAGIALHRQAFKMDKDIYYDIQQKYKRLGIIFIIYGLVDGLLVKEMNFFPASVINSGLFYDLFGFPIKLVNILIGIGIIYLLVQVLNTFEWEQKERVKKLEQEKIADEERKKIGLEIHDSIIQSMYAISLKINFLLRNNKEWKKQDILKDTLEEVTVDLGEAIKKTREFISDSEKEQIKLEERLSLLVEEINTNRAISMDISLEINKFPKDSEFSPKESAHIYFIIKEAVNNAIKHSDGTCVKIILASSTEKLFIKIIDNGTGFTLQDQKKKGHYGLKYMKKRADTIGASLNILSRKKGTEVELSITRR